jgi:hypothetical protein
MYQRIVCFKFKASASKQAIQSHLDHFARLKDEIPQIVSYAGGLTCNDELGNQPSFDSIHYATYQSMEDIEAYYHHPAHQDFIKANQGIWEDVLVLNSTM